MVSYFLRQDPCNPLLFSYQDLLFPLSQCLYSVHFEFYSQHPFPRSELGPPKGTLHSSQGADLLLQILLCLHCSYLKIGICRPRPSLGFCCVGFAVPFDEDPQPLQVTHPVSHCLPSMILNTDNDTTLVFQLLVMYSYLLTFPGCRKTLSFGFVMDVVCGFGGKLLL